MHRDLAAAFELIDDFVQQDMDARGVPGVAIGVTDRRELLWESVHGYANIESRTPMTADMRFQIGSISKSFASIVLLQLQEEGRLDIHDPVTKHLPWLRVRSRFAPITTFHLMTHTAGIVRGTDSSPSAFSAAFALRDLEAAAPPGTYFHYSNTGYKILGLVIESVLGVSNGQAIRERVVEPLGMSSTETEITSENRSRQPTGYAPFYDDRPPKTCGRLAPATWFESDTADGSIISTASDMARYLRMLLNGGRGPEGRVVSAESFQMLTRKVIRPADSKHGESYGLGLEVGMDAGHTVLGHTGGMVGFVSEILADMDQGIGVVFLTNSCIESGETARWALKAVRSAMRSSRLPPCKKPTDPTVVKNASAYAGVYRCGKKRLLVEASQRNLLLSTGSDIVTLERRGKDRFYAGHPDLEMFLLQFGRSGGRVVELFHGADWYTNEHYSGKRTFDTPRRWRAFVGQYRSHNPWLSNFRVLLRKGQLMIVMPDGLEEPMTPLTDGSFRVGLDRRSPERIRFEEVVRGRATKAVLSDGEWYSASVE